MSPRIFDHANRRLVLYASPVFAYWVILLVGVALLCFWRTPTVPATWILATWVLSGLTLVLFLTSPVFLILGWARFAKQREYRDAATLKPGRICLTIASVLAAPMVGWAVTMFVMAFRIPGSH